MNLAAFPLLPGPVARFARERPFDTLCWLFSGIIFTFLTSKGYMPPLVAFALPFVFVALLGTRDPDRRFLGLAVVAAGLILTVGLNFYAVANHGFLMVFLALAMTVSAAAEADEPGRGAVHMRTAAAWLLGILMGVALMQKLLSPHYMAGNLVGTLMVTGEAYRTLGGAIWDGWPGVLKDTAAATRTLSDAAPGTLSEIALPLPALTGAVALLLTWAALASQAGLEVLLLARRRIGIWLHVGVLTFVAIIYVTRPENIFLSLNCFMGFSLTDESTKAARPAYVVAILFLLATELTGIRLWPFG